MHAVANSKPVHMYVWISYIVPCHFDLIIYQTGNHTVKKFSRHSKKCVCKTKKFFFSVIVGVSSQFASWLSVFLVPRHRLAVSGGGRHANTSSSTPNNLCRISAASPASILSEQQSRAAPCSGKRQRLPGVSCRWCRCTRRGFRRRKCLRHTKSSGAMWMGVPTMVHVIMASGLQNPRSVRVPRFWLSSCERRKGGEREWGEREREREKERISQ